VEDLAWLVVRFLFEILAQALFELPGYLLRWMFGVSAHDDPEGIVAAFLGLGFWGFLVVSAVVIWRIAH